MNMQFFEYNHLPTHLRAVSKDIYAVALKMTNELPEGDEKAAGMRKLLEAKDCFVRAILQAPIEDTIGFTVINNSVETMRDTQSGQEYVRCRVFLNSNEAIKTGFTHQYPIGVTANMHDIPRLVSEQAEHIMHDLHRIEEQS